MELLDFLQQVQADTRALSNERFGAEETYPYLESVFADVVMQHMAEIGMTAEPQVCHYQAKVGNATVKLSGFAVSDDADQLDLFVCLYDGVDTVAQISDADTKGAAEQCLRFLAKCAEGKLAAVMDESNDAYPLAVTIQGSYSKLDQIRIYVLTDRQAKSKSFKPRDVSGKTVKLEVMDIERLHRHWSEGKPRDELVVNFEEVSGSALPCVFVPGSAGDYDYAMTAVPGEALRFLYERFGARLLEANVRSFLSVTGKVNRGIRDTLRDAPSRFMAYNNGIVVVADEAGLGRTSDGGPGLVWLKGMQIVNGGQTTASLYFAKRKSPEIDLSAVRVPAKVIVLRSKDDVAEEALISDISRYANSQNAVKQSDLSANKPFHVELEKLAMSTYCPDGVGRWFYERAAGAYSTMLAREGTTPAKVKRLKETIPPSRRITKTDLAKYLNAWDLKPHWVSLGAQKNFERYMESVAEEGAEARPKLDVALFKNIVAKAIFYRAAVALVRPMFPAFQANIATYLASVASDRVGPRVNLEKIWNQQAISPAFKLQLQTWAAEVHKLLHDSAGGRMISEWAKRPECWDVFRSSEFSPAGGGIPELR